jgi:hypothetical protein
MNFGNVYIHESSIQNNQGASLGGGIVSFTPAPGKISVMKSSVDKNILTNAQTITQTIKSFLEVIIQSLQNIADQSSGPGGEHFKQQIPSILEKMRTVHDQLQLLPIEKNTIAGGGIAALLSTDVSVVGTRIDGNCAGQLVSEENVPFKAHGGGLFGHNTSFTVKETNICNNHTEDLGGGIYNRNNLTIVESIVKHNCALNGGGIYTTEHIDRKRTTIKKNHPNNVVIV